MLLLHIQQLAAVVCLYGLYSVLQGFYRFFVGGYLTVQCGVFPLQCLDFVTSEKRTDTFRYVGDCGCGCTFQLLDLNLPTRVIISSAHNRAVSARPCTRLPTQYTLCRMCQQNISDCRCTTHQVCPRWRYVPYPRILP